MRLVDFHCHLDLYPDPTAAIAAVDAAEIYTLAVTTTPRAWPENLRLTNGASRIRVALGLHPQLVKEHSHEIALWEEYLPDARYVGEVGLDAGPRFYRSLDLQKQTFERILQRCALSGDKILTVHSVRSAKTVLDMIETYLPPTRGKVVLHWFTGTKTEARRAADLGCYFSVNAAMLRSDRGRSLVSELPPQRILTETDGPFTQTGNRASSPMDVSLLIDDLSALTSSSRDHVVDAIFSNLRALCGEP